MRKRIIALALMCMTASAVAAPVAGVAPSKVLTFKDWTVGCDNGLACQAVALTADDASERNLSVVIKRGEGIGTFPIIELAGEQNRTGSYRVLIDGKAAATASIPVDAEFLSITGAEAMRLARLMAKGRTIGLSDNSRVDLGSASLVGAAAALRYIDAQQGRAGSVGAVVASGKKKPTVKKTVLPIITATKIVPTGMLPDATALVALSENSPCATDRFGSTQDIAYSLGTTTKGPQALVMLNCGAGAYNTTSGIYVGQQEAGGKWTFAPARFDYGSYGVGEDKSVPVLINSDWDPATLTIGNYNKARGIGDCGSSETWVWDGSMFRLTGATVMRECRGSVEWIPVWRAEVKLTP